MPSISFESPYMNGIVSSSQEPNSTFLGMKSWPRFTKCLLSDLTCFFSGRNYTLGSCSDTTKRRIAICFFFRQGTIHILRNQEGWVGSQNDYAIT